ncbi:MAG: tyrosine-type recombinase/integrase [Bacteroidota bacterium]
MLTTEQAITDFLNHCRYEKNLSPKTLKFYTIDLRQFTEFLQSHKYPSLIAELDKVSLKAYLKELYVWKPKTIKRKVATIKALFNYLEYEDLIAINPLRKIKIKIKEATILPKALTKNETGQLLQTAYTALATAKTGHYDYIEKVRNTAIVEMLFATGARVSEIANLKISDIDLISGKIYIKSKGNKERIIYICNADTLQTLNNYRNSVKAKQACNNEYFWVNRLSRKLSDQSIRIMVRNLASNAQIGKRVTPHVFRHTFATLLLENDVDIKYIQSLLGHSSIMTTQIYTQVNREQQKRLLEEKHPRKELMLNISSSE